MTHIARGICQEDLEMAQMLGEIFDIVGPDGLIIIEAGNRAEIEREYVDGTYWHLSGWLSRLFITDKTERRAMFEDTALVISDFKIKDPNDLVPVLDRSARAGVKKLVILCKELSDSAVGLLMTNNEAKTIETMAVRTPKVRGDEQIAAMEDIAVLTGGRVFYAEANDTFETFQPEDLGYARRAWAMESLFGLLGGKGDARRVRQSMLLVREKLRKAETDNEKKNLQQRLGRLSGSTAILRVGGSTATEIEARKRMAERAVLALRQSIVGGVVAGGGAALLAAQSALAALPVEHEEDALAYAILSRALEEPMRTIVRNAGSVPEVVIEKAKACPLGFGYDARTRQIVDLRAAGVLDSVVVLRKALEIGVSGAAMALTTDVIVHHRKPKESIEP
jgi:chaperonin GroEL